MKLAKILQETSLSNMSKLLPSQYRALEKIQACRTERSGRLVGACTDCGKMEVFTMSCGHRFCPQCQNHQSTVWLNRQKQKLLPVKYFMITFTIPFELRKIFYLHQRELFSLLFECSAEVLVEQAKKKKFGAGELGFTGVLHTHSRRLDFHPHIHYIVPAGILRKSDQAWLHRRGKSLFSGDLLAAHFRGKLLAKLIEKGFTFAPSLYNLKWVVNCEEKGRGKEALEYLSRYLYRGVISEKNVHENKDGTITFYYEDSNTKQRKSRTESKEDFIKLLLQHVLPRGFRRVRDFGFLHGNAKATLQKIQYILRSPVEIKEAPPRPSFLCPCCKGKMKVIAILGAKKSASSERGSPPNTLSKSA